MKNGGEMVAQCKARILSFGQITKKIANKQGRGALAMGPGRASQNRKWRKCDGGEQHQTKLRFALSRRGRISMSADRKVGKCDERRSQKMKNAMGVKIKTEICDLRFALGIKGFKTWFQGVGAWKKRG